MNDLDTVVNRQVHIFYQGEAWDLDMDNLDVGILSTDAEIRRAVANALDIPEQKLANFRVAKNEETEDITLTPQPVFGKA